VTGQRAQALVGVPNAANSNYLDIEFQDGQPLNVTGGEVFGLVHQRDTDLPQRIADLDTLVGSVMTEVNAVHAAGFGLDGLDGRAFFAGTGAADITVDAAIAADPLLLAASATAAGVPGDGSNALAIGDLQYARLLAGGTATFDDYYGNYVASLGVASREAQARESTQTLVLQQLEQQRQSASGVNLDEEIVALTQYQRAYEAASHLVRVADEMLDTLINRTI
jgi:flagellar hook-associated protein 1 FlgK